MREWTKVKNDLIEVETKEKMKERTGRSPDLFDWLAIAVEGARRRGFQVSKLANAESEASNLEWLDDLRQKMRELRERKQLNYRV